MSPRVTAVIPTYQCSSVLPYSIASVLGQTMEDFELLVVGDGCTDDSEQVVRAIDDRRVRWINLARSHGHQSGPNNEALRQARGELIAYLGHDDLWLPQHLASLTAAIDAGADLACSETAVIGPESRFVRRLIPEPQRDRRMPPSCVMHRRGVTDDVGGWRDHRQLEILPEQDLWRRARMAGWTATVVPRVTVLKFTASLRRNVYRERPCHEQAGWLSRIQSAPDFEASDLGRMVMTAKPYRRYSDPLGKLSRLLREPSLWLSMVWRRPGALVKAIQRYKGVNERPC